MPPKNIYIGEEGLVILANERDFQHLLTNEGIRYLVNEAGGRVYGHDALEHNGKYKRGPPRPIAATMAVPFAPSGGEVAHKVVRAYNSVGAHLVPSKEIQAMISVVNSIEKMRPDTLPSGDLDEKTAAGVMPFVMFEGSSMMGKTQSFWSLAHGCTAHPCLYVPVASGQQTLHTAFGEYNNTLNWCLAQDAGRLAPPESKEQACPRYEVNVLRGLRTPFSTLGFLRRLLRELKKAKKVDTPWIETQADLRFEYKLDETCSCEELIAEGLFIVGIDEVQVLAVAKVQLLRNLVRAAGGIAVMIGTSSSIVNIISSPDKISREAVGMPLPWSYLIVNFPQIEDTTLKIRYK